MMPVLTMLMVMAALAGVVLVLRRSYWAFLLVVFMFAIEQLAQSYLRVLQENRALFNYSVAGLSIWAVFTRACRTDQIFSGLKNPVTFLIFGQFALWLIGMLFTPAPEAARYAFDSSWRYMILLLLILPLLVGDLEEFRRMLVGAMVVGMVVALLILLNPNTSYYAGRLMIDIGMTGLRRSEMGNPLATAELGGMVALIAALFVPQTKGALFSAMRITALILGLGLTIGSGSRGQLFATVVAGLLFYPMARRLNNVRNFILSALGLCVLVAVLMGTFQLFIGDQNRERWDTDMMIRDVQARFDSVWVFLDAYAAQPSRWLFGLGTSSFANLEGASEFQGVYVHNLAIEVLCEQGLVGATVFALIMYLTFRMGRSLWKQYRDDPSMRSVVAVLCALGVYSFFQALKQGNIPSAAPFYWWLVLAKLATHERQFAPVVEYETETETEADEQPTLDERGYPLAVARG